MSTHVSHGRRRRRVSYSTLMNIGEDLYDLPEEIACQTLVESMRTFTDEIVEITAVLRTFENENPAILMKKVI